jgi:vitamin B12 transporter
LANATVPCSKQKTGRRHNQSKSEDLPISTNSTLRVKAKNGEGECTHFHSILPPAQTINDRFMYFLKKHSLVGVGILLCTFLSLPRASAQSIDSAGARKLNEVVVSANRTEQDPDSVGRSVTVITSEQIRNSGAISLAEVLSQQEGIYVVGTGQNPGQSQNLFMRGANSNQTTFMIDGIRITDPSSTDNAIQLEEVSLANIERVEIVRGAHSTLYGSSAIGGVINIITKKNGKAGLHADAEVMGGVFGEKTSVFTENVSLNYTGKKGFYASGEVYNNKTNGLDATVDSSANKNTFRSLHRDRDGFRKTDLIGKIGYRTEKIDAFVSYKRVDQKADIDGGAFNDDPAYTVGFQRNLFTYGISAKLSPEINLAYVGGVTNSTRVAVDDSSIVDSMGTYNHNYYKGTYKGSTVTHDAQISYHLKWLRLLFGIGAFNEKMTANTYFYSGGSFGVYQAKTNLDSLNINVNTISEYVHVEIDGSVLREKFKVFVLGMGARYAQHDVYGNNLTYELNPSLKVGDGGLAFATLSSGFNAPSLYQLYAPDADPNSRITRGNKYLRPETSTSVEFGFKQRINNRFSFHFSYFKTVVENSIDYVYLWNSKKPTDSLTYSDYRGDTYVNIGKQTTQGFELGIHSKMTDKLILNANISLVNGRLDYDPSNVNNEHSQNNRIQLFANGAFLDKQVQTYSLVRRPSTANVNLTYSPVSRLSFRADLSYTGSRNDVYYNSSLGPNGAQSTKGMGDYTLLHVSARYKILTGLTAALKVENVFDEHYSEIYGYTTRGRSFYLTLHYSF